MVRKSTRSSLLTIGFTVLVGMSVGSVAADSGAIPEGSTEAEIKDISKKVDSQQDATEKIDINEKQIGQYQIKFGGWSEHYISGNASNYNFNESHEGIGFAYSNYDASLSDSRFFNGFNYEFWYMKDSFYKDNVQASYGIFHRKLVDSWGIESIDVGINFAAISRSSADINTKTAELDDHKRIHTLMLIPSLSLYTHYKVHLDFVFLPAIPNVTDYSVLFFRAGFNL